MNRNSQFVVPRHWTALLVVVLLACVTYSNTLSVPFLFDDYRITDPKFYHISQLTFEEIFKAGFHSEPRNRPVANMTLALDFYFEGVSTKRYHLVNIIIHVINCCLVYFLALATFSRLTNNSDQCAPPADSGAVVGKSLLAACIFAAHPTQTQAVTYIVQRMSSMAAMFYLCSLLLYIHGRTSTVAWKRWVFWAGGLISWGLGLGTKETTATLPFAVFLYEWFFFQGLNRQWFLRRAVILAGLVVALAAVAVGYLGSSPLDAIDGSYAKRDFTMSERLLTQPRVILLYTSLLLFPVPSRLNLLHYIPTSHALMDPASTGLALLAIVGGVLIGISLASRQRLISFCILWFFGNLAIESSFIGLEMAFEHRLYLPLFGCALLTSHLLFSAMSRRPIAATIVAVLLVLLLAAAAHRRNWDWQNALVFWSDVMAKNRHDVRVVNNRGRANVNSGNYKQAIVDLTYVIQQDPKLARAYNQRGRAYAYLERYQGAIADFSKAIELVPIYAQAYQNRGGVYEKIGEIDLAMADYREAIQLQPDMIEAYHGLGISYAQRDLHDLAVDQFTMAIQRMPNFVDAYYERGISSSKLGNFPQAVADLTIVITRRPDNAQPFYDRGLAYAEQGNYPVAIVDFSKSIQLRPNRAEAYYRRARSYYEVGQFAKASVDMEAYNKLGGKPRPEFMKQLSEALETAP